MLNVLRGRAAFGPELEALLAADPHRPGSVDAVLLDCQQPPTVQTQRGLYAPPAGPPPYERGSRPELESFVHSAQADATHEALVAARLTQFCGRIPRLFPSVEGSTASGFYGDFRAFLCGGAEEEVIRKGSPLAAERARVLCAMAQVAGLSARIVFLARTDPPERHAVTEISILGRWSVFDAFSGRFYTYPKHGYASAWDIRGLPQLVDNHPDHSRQRYVNSSYYRNAGIATYDIADAGSYAYPSDPIPPDLAARLQAGLGA